MLSDEVVVTIEPDLSQYTAAVDRVLWEMCRRITDTPSVYLAMRGIPKPLPFMDPRSLFDLAAQGCWASHDRPQESDLERAVRQYNEANPVATFSSFNAWRWAERLYAGLLGSPFKNDETSGTDTEDCSASGGGSWSDFMARLDDVLEEE